MRSSSCGGSNRAYGRVAGGAKTFSHTGRTAGYGATSLIADMHGPAIGPRSGQAQGRPRSGSDPAEWPDNSGRFRRRMHFFVDFSHLGICRKAFYGRSFGTLATTL